MLKCYTPSIAAVALLILSVLLWEVVVSLATDLNALNASSSNSMILTKVELTFHFQLGLLWICNFGDVLDSPFLSLWTLSKDQ